MNIIKLTEATQGKPVWVYAISNEDPEKPSTYAYSIFRKHRDIPFFRKQLTDTFCAKDFERFTGLKLKPGECMRIRFGVMPV